MDKFGVKLDAQPAQNFFNLEEIRNFRLFIRSIQIKRNRISGSLRKWYRLCMIWRYLLFGKIAQINEIVVVEDLAEEVAVREISLKAFYVAT